MIQRHYLDGVEVTTPSNYQELSIELNYDTDGNSQAVTVNNWDWGVGDQTIPNDGYLKAKKHFDDGLCFVGLPHKIELDGQRGTTYTLLDGFSDLSKAEFFHDKLTAPSQEKGKLDWLNDTADTFSFAYLESIGKINSNDYVQVPYCIEKKQNAFEVILTIATLFVVTDKIKEQIAVIQEMSASAGNQFEATVIIRLIFRILYITALLVSLISLVIQLYNMIVQPVKYHAGMYVTKQIEKGLAHLGLTLSSSILQRPPFNQMCLIPEKYQQVENTGLFAGVQGQLKFGNSNETGYYNGTFGQLLRDMKTMFKAKILIIDNVLYFEKFDFKLSSPRYTLPNLWDSKYQFTLNSNECISNLIISFLTDGSDKNTIQEYQGTSVQVTTSLNGTYDSQLNLLQGFSDVRLPFALGKRKTELSNSEKILDLFYKSIGAIIEILITVINAILAIINVLIQLINALIKALKTIGLNLNFKIQTIQPIEISAFKSLIETRIGMLKMESDYINVPKLILVGNGSPRYNTLLQNNESVLNAKYLFDNYHYFVSFIGRNDWVGNQYYLRSFEDVPFTFDDFEKVRLNNEIFDDEGNELKLLSLRFNPYKGTASGDYKQQKQYVTNLKETIHEPS